MQSGEIYPIRPNPEFTCPPEILNQQIALSVQYYGFGRLNNYGVIEINRLVADDVKQFFALAYQLKFPIEKVAAASDMPYGWNDDRLMEENVSSGFNYRLVAGTDKVSLHGQGLAFDINPIQNPYIRYENGQTIIAPKGASWNPSKPGTLTSNHPLVHLMRDKGWEWGGNWTMESGRIDYQHFQKQIVTN